MDKILFVIVTGLIATSVAGQSSQPPATVVPVPGVGSSRAKVVLPPEKQNPIRLPQFDRPPVIDGKLDDEVWKQAVKLKDFYQTTPGDNIAPSQPTEVFLGYDAKSLYVAFHCYDDPSKVRANISKRDNIFNDDYVGMLLDTFNDHRKAYELDFNPLGVQEDGIWQDPIYNEDFNPDFVMESKGTLTSDGYVVEVAIPFKSLRYEAGKNKLWGVHFYRRIKRINNEFDSWMPIDRADSGWL
ncbi:MAG TPA: carbohydrate binding family 9 domain-containing protein, partial [Pyrinomonadaceae bacterium]|nr:carbohydrate binding family 9 domain-containing protein [Pyrinomonadaceae bacterium]